MNLINNEEICKYFGICTLEQAANYCKIKADTLLEYTQSGHAPHYYYDKLGPFYKKAELKKWLKENLITRNGGFPLPKEVPIIKAVDSYQSFSPPQSIASIEGMLQLPVYARLSCIYFLCDGNEVVYVGQSRSVVQRIMTHIKEGVKEFDEHRIYILPTPPAALNQSEDHYIRILQPKYNSTIGRNSNHQ